MKKIFIAFILLSTFSFNFAFSGGTCIVEGRPVGSLPTSIIRQAQGLHMSNVSK